MQRSAKVVAAGALIVGLVLSISGAASAQPPSPSPHGDPGLTGGWQESLNPNGQLMVGVTFDRVNGFVYPGGARIELNGIIHGGGENINEFMAPAGQTLQAGHTYYTALGAGINAGTCAGMFEVDQLVVSGNTPTSAGIRYQMFCQGTEYFGAMAISLSLQPGQGYYLFENSGRLSPFGNNAYLSYLGDLGATPLGGPIVGMGVTPGGGGYWLAGADGGVFAYGDATFFGSAGGLHLAAPVVGIAVTPDGGGYWLVAADGGIFAFGDAKFEGSAATSPLASPVVGMAATPDGAGYWLVTANGLILPMGDAPSLGSVSGPPFGGSLRLNGPIVGMASTPDGHGYWLVGSDGGIFAFGDARFLGSAGGLHLAAPIAGMTATASGGGYWLTGRDGGVFSFGDAPYDGGFGGGGSSAFVGLAL